MRVFSHVVIFLLWFFYLTCFADTYSKIPTIFVSSQNTPADNFSHAGETVITHEEMDTLGITSLAEALQELGGVQLEDMTGTGNQVLLSLRGFGANANSNTLLMVNGIPITNPDMMPPDLNAIPIQEIQHIDIIAGSESVLYGDQAVGGIINIVTQEQHQDQETVSCNGGSYDQKNCSVALSNHIKNLRYSVGVMTNHTDNYRLNNDYDQNLLSGRFDYPYQTGAFSFDYKIVNERMLYPGALTAEQVRQNRRQASNYFNFFKDWNGFYHVHQQQSLNSNWEFETDLARREMHGSGVLSLPFTQSRVVHFIKPQLKGVIGHSLLNAGVDFENDSYNLNSVFDVTTDSLQKYGVFGLLAIPINARWAIALGARAAQQNNQLMTDDDTNTLNRATATTLSTSYQLTPNIKWYLRRAGSFRFPKADENGSTPPGVNGLKTQQGVSYETGLQTQWKILQTKFSVYQLNLIHEIAFDPTQTAADPFGTNRNLDPTVRKGFTVSENAQLSDKINLGAQYNYVNARFNSGFFQGNRIPLVSENLLHTGLDFKITSHWNVYTEAIYTGNQYSANDYANIAGQLGGYTTYNVNLRYANGGFSASLRVNNIFNKYYYLYTVFEPSMPSQFFYPAPGRNFLLTIKYLLT